MVDKYLDQAGLSYFWSKIKDYVQTAIENQEVLDAVSGKIINVTNAKAGAQIKELRLLNASGEEVTGKKVAITNKNLFRIDLLPNSTKNLGVTFTKNADGSISASGTSTGGYASTKCNIDKNAFVPGIVYSMGCGKTGGPLYVQLALTFTDNTTEYFVASSNYTVFMVPKTVKTAVGSVQITNSGTSVDQTVWPQIEIAGAATSFAINYYTEITYPSGAMPSLPATVSNVYSNDDTVQNIEMTYIQDTSAALKEAQERITSLEARMAQLLTAGSEEEETT